MITREQLDDLRPGDVVEVTDERSPGVIVRGPVTERGGHLALGLTVCLGCRTGSDQLTFTVVSRAPRPLYVNHDRGPVPGDVARLADTEAATWAAWYGQDKHWHSTRVGVATDFPPNCDVLLLVDGTTGQVVP